MIHVVVRVVLLLWGAVVGRAGRKVGTALALIPVLVWFGILAWFGWSGNPDSPAGDALPAYLVIGLLAFLIGERLTDGRSAQRRSSRSAAGLD